MTSLVFKKELREGDHCLDKRIENRKCQIAFLIALQIKEHGAGNVNGKAVVLDYEIVLFRAQFPVYAVKLVSLIIFSQVEYLRGIIAGLVLGENVALLVDAVGIMDYAAYFVTFRHDSYVCAYILRCPESEQSERIVDIQTG